MKSNICSKGATLGKRMKEAEVHSKKQRAAADELEKAFTPEKVEQVKRDILEWNEKPDESKNPYVDEEECKS